MKTIFRIFALSLVFTEFSSDGFAQTATASTSVIIISSVILTKSGEMSFEATKQNTARGISVSKITSTAAEFSISDPSNTVFSISVPHSAIKLECGDQQNLSISNFLEDVEPANLSSNGMRRIKIRADLNTYARATRGNYLDKEGLEIIINYN